MELFFTIAMIENLDDILELQELQPRFYNQVVGLINAYWTNAKVEQKLKGRKQSHAAAWFPHATACSVPLQNPDSNMSWHASLVPRHEDP